MAGFTNSKILLSAVLVLSTFWVPVHAENTPVIAIIDSGINSSLFKSNLINEVCLLSKPECPNKKTFMEGSGSSNIGFSNNEVLYHGTNLVSVMTQIDTSVKIVFIRIVGIDSMGNPENYSLDDIDRALTWITKNQKKFNISVVNISQGNTFNTCEVSSVFKKQVSILKKANVPVIASAGNYGNNQSVFTPACWKDTISIGASDSFGNIQPYSNSKGKVDFYTNDNYSVTMLDGTKVVRAGTSNSTAAFSVWWILNRKASFDETFNYLMSTTVDAKNKLVTGRYISIA